MRMYSELCWTQVNDSLKDNVLIIPVGSIEQHGPHLPVTVDSLLANRLAIEIAKKIDGIVAPTITYGARSLPTSGGGPTYPGTIYLDGNVLINMYKQIINSFIKTGAVRILLLNSHWENETFIIEAIEKCREDGILEGKEVIELSWWSVITEKEMYNIFGEFSGWHVEHAGQAETALMSYYFPEYVKMQYSVDCLNNIPSGIYKYPVPDGWSGNMGVLSKTKHINLEMGEKLANLVVTKISNLLG